jgi:YVTN family beta-propeller protein
VYVVDTGATTLTVIDVARGEVAGSVDLGAKPHGLVAAPDGSAVYATVGWRPGFLVAVDTREHLVRWRLEVGPGPHQPAIGADGARIFVPDFEDSTVRVVDPSRPAVVATTVPADAGGPLRGLHNAYAGASHIFVTAVEGRALAILDVRDGRALAVQALPGSPRPAALAPDGRTLYLQTSEMHGVLAWDAEAGREVGRVEWSGAPAPGAPEASAPGHGIGVAPGGAELWAASTIDSVVRVLALPSLETVGEVPVGRSPNWIAFSPDGARVFVSNSEPGKPRGTVTVIDRAARVGLATIPVGPAPKRLVALRAP